MKSGIKYLVYILLPFLLYSQDPSYSLNFSVPVVISPAFAGLQEGEIGLYSSYRMRKLTPIENYSTTVIFGGYAIETEKLNGGAGVLIINDVAGGLRTTELHGIFAYEAPFGRRVRYDHLRAAIQLGLVNRALNINKQTFEDQFNGVGFGGQTAESFDRFSIFNADVSISMMYYRTRKIKGNPEFAPYIGFGVAHINKPNIGFYKSAPEPLSMRWTGFAGGRMYTRTPLDVNGYIIFNYHNNSYLWTLGGNLRYVIYENNIWFRNEKAAVSVGVLLRPGDTFMSIIGFEFYKSLLIAFSYDLLTSKDNILNKNFGGLQIAARYYINPDFWKKKPELPFPDF